LRYLTLRLLFIPVAAFVVLTISFFLVNIIPSNPAAAVLGNLAGPKQIAEYNHAHGLDQSVPVRYWHYLTALVHGDMGQSFYDNTSVASEIQHRFVSSLELIVGGLIVAWLLGTLLGSIGAYYRGRRVDGAISAVIGLIQSVPDFVIGLLGAVVLCFTFTLLPAPLGQLPIGVVPPRNITGAAFVDAILSGNWSLVGPAGRQLILPVLALGIANSVIFARTVRTTLGQALDSNYSEFARARGLRARTVVRLALRASLLPTITYAGIVFANLVGGVAIVEQVFSWQGLGQWGVKGVQRSDIPVVEGFVIVAGVVSIVAYLVADLVNNALDPRIGGRTSRRSVPVGAIALDTPLAEGGDAAGGPDEALVPAVEEARS
jgi:peptide/nickel transport system permease protein